MGMLPTMLEQNRKRADWSVEQAARRLGVSIREHREIESGERSPNGEQCSRISKTFGWPETFAGRP